MVDEAILKMVDSFKAGETEVGRRDFLKLGAGALVSLYVGAGMTAVSKPAFAGSLVDLSVAEGKTLMMVTKTLFPHDHIDDGYYMNVVAAIDAKCSGDPDSLRMVRSAIEKLDSVNFSNAAEVSRENILGEMEGSEFFSMVYGETVNGLYLNKEIWNIFGYEGSSKEQGGYLNRGFDDLDWLPNS